MLDLSSALGLAAVSELDFDGLGSGDQYLAAIALVTAGDKAGRAKRVYVNHNAASNTGDAAQDSVTPLYPSQYHSNDGAFISRDEQV